MSEEDEYMLVPADAEKTCDDYVYFGTVEVLPTDNNNKGEYDEVDVDDDCIEEDGDLSDVLLENPNSHTLLLRKSDDAAETYYCMQCVVEYKSIDEFNLSHQVAEIKEEEHLDIVEEQWEALDETENCGDEETQLIDEANEIGYTEKLEEELQDETNDSQLIEGPLEQEFPAENSNADSDSNKFYCYDCGAIFEGLKTAEQHLCKASKADSNKEDVNNPQAELTDDDDESAVETEYQCALCDDRFPTIATLEQHHFACHETPEAYASEFKCFICEKMFGSEKALKSHNRVHKFTESVVCEICNTTFGSAKNLKLHMKIHDKRRAKTIQEALPAGAKVNYSAKSLFYCEICKKSFDQNLLTVHRNMHQNVEEYNCGVCNKQFETLSSYEVHMQMHTEKSNNESRNNTNEQNLSEGKLFQCQYCWRSFPRPHEKVKHERVHTGEKPYECEVCGKTFRVSYSLTLHLRTHTDIRPYVCATCNKRFKSQPVYAHHLKTHLVERAYKCDVCMKTFRTGVQLCAHKNSHTKPFNCQQCNRPFASLYAVKIHMKTHNRTSNDSLKHSCQVCGAVYARTFALKYHMKEQHSMTMDGNNVAGTETENTVYLVDDPQPEPDEAMLMAAATECAVATITDEVSPHLQHYTEDEISTQAILQDEIIQHFATEEIVTDWLSK